MNTSMCTSISLRAILAGTIIALAMQSLLNLLGLGLDLVSFRVNAGVIENVTFASFVWLIVTSAVSMFVGGLVAGRACNSNLPSDGVLHAIVAWGLATLISFMFFMPTAELLIGGVATLIAQSFSATGQAVITGGVAHIEPKAAEFMLRGGQILGSVAIVTFAAFAFSAVTATLGGIFGAACCNKCKK